MKWTRRAFVSALSAVVAAVAAASVGGCGPEQAINLSYQRPAKYEISPDIRALGIAAFGGQTADDRRWGDIAADRLGAELDKYNRKYNRYQLVDRKRLKALLDEQDLQAAFSDSAHAVQAGKIAKVDAMIYGSVAVNTRDERASRSVIDPLQRSTRTVYYTKRYVMASVNFTIDNVGTGNTLTTVSTVREFDSEKGGPGGAAAMMSKAFGFGGDQVPAAEQVTSALIDQCVEEFVTRVSPHDVRVKERLGKGRSGAVSTGNTLAVAGDYAEALEMYQAAVQADAADHQAAFNAGLMQEALGRLAEAEKLYEQAFKIKPESQYVLARKRVRQEAAK